MRQVSSCMHALGSLYSLQCSAHPGSWSNPILFASGRLVNPLVFNKKHHPFGRSGECSASKAASDASGSLVERGKGQDKFNTKMTAVFRPSRFSVE
jgi:hypothetical protein